MYETLRTVVVRRPDRAFGEADPATWHYVDTPDLPRAVQEHDELVAILRRHDVEVLYHDVPLPNHADALFVHDPVIVTGAGAVILSMGKDLRRGEEAAIRITLEANGVPTHAALDGTARAEGGDLLWLDRHTLAAGHGFRTNGEGIRQLLEALAPLGVDVLPVPLPFFQGAESCLHLMSLISVLDSDLAVVYPPLLPVPFWQELLGRGFELVEVPEEEFPSMGPNVLALAPRRCLMLEGNPLTARRLEATGCEVITYCGDELSLKAEGGPTCLTRPLWRSNELIVDIL